MIQLKINSYTTRDTYILLTSLRQAKMFLLENYPHIKTQASDDLDNAIQFLAYKFYNSINVENSVETVEN